MILPIACVARWHREGERFPFAIEVIGFAEEEGVRFKATLLGSRAVAGTFDNAVLERQDDSGATMRAVMAGAGFDADALPRCACAQRGARLCRSAYRAGAGAAG